MESLKSQCFVNCQKWLVEIELRKVLGEMKPKKIWHIVVRIIFYWIYILEISAYQSLPLSLTKQTFKSYTLAIIEKKKRKKQLQYSKWQASIHSCIRGKFKSWPLSSESRSFYSYMLSVTTSERKAWGLLRRLHFKKITHSNHN